MTAGRVTERRERALQVVDDWPPALRQCVHEYGYAIVQAFVSVGIRSPQKIRRLVQECWAGARSPTDRISKRGTNRNRVAAHLDWILLQQECPISATTLVRVLADHNMVIVPREPSEAMIQASMDALADKGWVTKHGKHKIRLKAALECSTRRLWPHLYEDGSA